MLLKRSRPRIAIATLELVLALPVILALMVALVWLGFSVIHQAQVDVVARHEAWGERFEAWTGQPFDFSSTDSQAKATETKQVKVTPVLDQLAGPEATCVVEMGPWDHRSFEFDSFPNIGLAAEMAMAAKTAGIKAQIEDLQQALKDLQDLGESSLQEILREIASELTNPGSQLKADGEAGKRRVELDQKLEESRAEAALQQVEEELAAVKQRLKDGDKESDATWLLERQKSRLEIEVELAKQRLKDTKN